MTPKTASDSFYAIAMAQLAYARCIDEGRLEEWPNFFLDQCKYVITTDSNYRQGLEAGVIWADSKAMLQDRISSLREANIYGPHKYRHMLNLPLILKEEKDEVQAETSFLVIRVINDGPMDLFAVGRYIDRYKNTAEGMKLKERIVVCDSSHFHTLLAIPL
jgi:anthranilate 1,2-dioxygenase small subunit